MIKFIRDPRQFKDLFKKDVVFDGPNCYAPGTRVEKVNCEPGDYTPAGTLGTVESSISVPEPIEVNGHKVQHGYFIQWDGGEYPVFCMDIKVKAHEDHGE